MKIYHIILGVLIVVSSCVSDDAINEEASNQENFTFEKPENNLEKTNGEISEELHNSLQALSFCTAGIIYSNVKIQEEVQEYLAISGGNTIATNVIFSEPSELPELKEKLIDYFAILMRCGIVPSPEIQPHRPGVYLSDGGEGNENGGGEASAALETCYDLFINSVWYHEFMINNDTELFFPNNLDHFQNTKPFLRTISSTSSPNLSLLRDNEGYRFVPNHLAEYYFDIEYEGEDVGSYIHNPMRVNMANSYILVKESTVIARIKVNSIDDKY